MKITKEQLKRIIKEELENVYENATQPSKVTPEQVKEIEQVAKVFPKTPVGIQTIKKALADPAIQQELEQLVSEMERKTREMGEANMVTGQASTEDPAGYGQAAMSGAMGTPLIAALVGLPGYTALAAKIGYMAAPMGYLGATMVGGIAVGALLAYIASKKTSQGN